MQLARQWVDLSGASNNIHTCIVSSLLPFSVFNRGFSIYVTHKINFFWHFFNLLEKHVGPKSTRHRSLKFVHQFGLVCTLHSAINGLLSGNTLIAFRNSNKS